MDETNPAYENFLNNMTRMGRTPRETTRKVSASKFLGIDNLATAIQVNARKISILKETIKAQRLQTGAMIASLSSQNQEGAQVVAQSIMDIKKTMSSILQTLEAQEKFNNKKFLDDLRRQENEKRRKREGKLELGRKAQKSLQNTVEKVTRPIRNIFGAILSGIVKLFLGTALIRFLKFLANPRNRGLLSFISGMIEKTFPILVIGIGAVVATLPLLTAAITSLGNALLFSGITGGAGSFLGGAGSFAGGGKKSGFKKVPMTQTLYNDAGKKIGKSRIFRGFKIPRIRFNQGGVVPGTGNQDTVPAMLTPGEFVVKKNVVGVRLVYYTTSMRRLRKIYPKGLGCKTKYINTKENVVFKAT